MRRTTVPPPDESDREVPARYIVGIDCGTTNCAAAFVDTSHKSRSVENVRIAQIAAPGEIEESDVLPSFLYEAAPGEFPPGALRLPWSGDAENPVVGSFARDHGAEVPGRLVMSAKSWLSHAGVDRRAALLPWHGAADVTRLSPIDATARYLGHIRNCWNDTHGEFPLEDQDVVVTVPASFDEIARELTLEAAVRAGLPRVVLIEEPQAAFYSWIHDHHDSWQSHVKKDQVVLVCDIGGGTTDFTLIQVRPGGPEGLQFHRIAVGDHLILGGDNLDLSFAYDIEEKLGAGKLGPRQFGALVRNCQKTKEILLGVGAPERASVVVLGSGAAVIGGSRRVDVDRTQVERLLVDGFFPFVEIGERPSARRSGFQEFGLPYAPDPAVTRHLAAFLSVHASGPAGHEGFHAVRPDVVLFNGGVFSSETIRQRILDVIESWFSSSGKKWRPAVLANRRPELAVARGAAYFGLVRRGNGVRIVAGLPRTYYIGVETPEGGIRALCVVPAGSEEGRSIEISDRALDLLIRQPVEFPLFASSIRTTDSPGDVVDIDSTQLLSLPPIRTVVQSGKKAAAQTAKVRVNARVTEIGTLEVWCTEAVGNRSWRFQFDVRATPAQQRAIPEKGPGTTVDEATAQRCKEQVDAVFGGGRTTHADPRDLMKRLEGVSGMPREEWPPSLLRFLWEALMESAPGRRADPLHEARWLNAVGFCLRPGYGYPVDDWRAKQTWRIFHEGVTFSRNQSCRSEWLIMWRRIAGGLSAGQQQTLCTMPIAAIRSQGAERSGSGRKRPAAEQSWGQHEIAEAWRLVASCELLPLPVKIELGSLSVRMARRSGPVPEAAVWALGRIAARVPVYGPLNQLVPAPEVERWAESILEGAAALGTLSLALMQMSRATNDRFRDIAEPLRGRVIDYMESGSAPAHLIDLVRSGGNLNQEEENAVAGDRLPPGLRLSI